MNTPPFSIRPVVPGDAPFLWEMLYYAAHVNEEPGKSADDIRGNPALAKYVEHWGRAGDLGFVAQSRPAGNPLGAAWCRIYAGENKAYSNVDDHTPEIAIAVRPDVIGRGIGQALMTRLIDEARSSFAAIALNVRANSPALRFYQRMGFVITGEMANRVGGTSYDLRLALR